MLEVVNVGEDYGIDVRALNTKITELVISAINIWKKLSGENGRALGSTCWSIMLMLC